MAAGLRKDKYSSTNSREYFAEGVQSWFNNNRENDHDRSEDAVKRFMDRLDWCCFHLWYLGFGPRNHRGSGFC